MTPRALPWLLTTCLVTVSGVAAGTAPAGQDAPAAKPKEKKAYNVGSLVRGDLSLPTLDGKPLRFYPEDSEDKRVVVLVWWSLRDPLTRKAEPKLVKLAEKYASRGVSVLLVESNHDELVAGRGDPLEKLREFRKDAKLTLPLLLDHGNKVADEFAALCSNHAFVIDARRVVRYSGAIDNDPQGRLVQGRQELLKDAIEAALEGTHPERKQTRPKGRKLKRAPKAAPADTAPAGKASGSGR